MRVEVKVKPGAKKRKVEWRGEQLWVWVRAAPEKGKANEEVVETLAEFFGVSKRDVRIVRGEFSRLKLIEVEGVGGE